MGTHVQYSNADKLPNTGSVYPVGTAFLRKDPDLSLGLTQNIAVGKCEKIAIKATKTEIELEGEEGETEAFLMLNIGKEVSITARFTNDVPTPELGNFVVINRHMRRLAHATRPFTVVATATGGAKFTMATPTGYAVDELVQVYGSSYAGTWPVLAVDGTSITLGVPYTATAVGSISGPAASPVTMQTSSYFESYLITEVGENYGSKEVAKYDLTAKLWDSLNDTTSSVATVNTKDGKLLMREQQPENS